MMGKRSKRILPNWQENIITFSEDEISEAQRKETRDWIDMRLKTRGNNFNEKWLAYKKEAKLLEPEMQEILSHRERYGYR